MARMMRVHVRTSSVFGDGRERAKCHAAIIFLCLVLLLTACAQAPVTSTSPNAITPTVTETTSPPNSAINASETITLTIWGPEEFSPMAARGGSAMRAQVEEFTRAHPNINVDFVRKNSYGKGGVLDFLLQVQALVPTRLPDLAILDSREVDVAAKANVLQLLGHDIPSGAFADLFSPAQTLAQYDGRWIALPITLELQHLAYNTNVVSVPPATWTQLLEGSASFVFSADDDDAFLFQYLASRGRLAGALSADTTTALLSFYQRGRTAKLIPDNIFMLKTSREVWQFFAEGQIALASVNARDYLAEYTHAPFAGFAPLPTQDGTSTALVNSWNYVIVASEPRHRTAAAEFLNWLNEPSRLAAWATAAHVIPARRSTFAFAITSPAYADFLRKLLDAGIIAPTFAARASYAAAWRPAMQTVLRGQATPGEAALKATESTTP